MLYSTCAPQAKHGTRGVTVKPDNMRAAVMQGFATATDLADYLVKKGMPFRDSHEVVAQAVRHADEADVDLSELPLEVLQGFSGLIADDVYSVLTPEGSLNAGVNCWLKSI